MRSVSLILALAGLIMACDLAEEPFRQQLVVEALMVSGEPYPVVRLRTTFPIARAIPLDRGAVSGAEITIERIGPDGLPDEVVHYVEQEAGSGRYDPVAAPAQVEPGRRYRIGITVPEETGLVPVGQVVRGETVTPDTFRVVRPPPDTVRYNRLGPRIEVRTTPSIHPSRQTIYTFSIIALDPENHRLTPVYAELIDHEDRHRFVENSSPLLNEENYELNPDGTVNVPVPWFAIAFFGPNRFVMSAVDDALYDFIRSRDAQFGASTLSPGEIPDVLSNLSHAVGVFGSVAQASADVYVRE